MLIPTRLILAAPKGVKPSIKVILPHKACIFRSVGSCKSPRNADAKVRDQKPVNAKARDYQSAVKIRGQRKIRCKLGGFRLQGQDLS